MPAGTICGNNRKDPVSSALLLGANLGPDWREMEEEMHTEDLGFFSDFSEKLISSGWGKGN